MSTPDGNDRRPGKRRDPTRVLRVSQVNRGTCMYLEQRFPDLTVQGEISDVTRARSGHVYLTLQDEREAAQLRVVMFRSDVQRSRATLDKGAVIRVRGKLSLYEPRGTFQMLARSAVPAGVGDLSAQIERIRKRLEAAGLLDPERKRPLPRVPTVVAVVTSAHGAALHDIVRVARARCPVRIVVADCSVQGTDAPQSICTALEAAQRLPAVDVVIIGRGGGSADDLWAFNTETVARAIAACRVPTVSAVGHEVDVTLADLVADVRAATPSNAAELVVPDRDVLRAELASRLRRLERALEIRVGRARLRLERDSRRVVDPRPPLSARRQRLAACVRDLERAVTGRARERRATLERAERKLSRHDPRRKLGTDRAALGTSSSRLVALAPTLTAKRRAELERQTERAVRSAESRLEDERRLLSTAAARMDAMSPLKVLSRGYGIVLHGEPKRALLRAADAAAGDPVELVLHDGRLNARIEGDGKATP